MFPFVILSQKQRIKRYNLQFGGKEKRCASLPSLKAFFQKAERQIWRLVLKCSNQEFYDSTHPPLHWGLILIQQIRSTKSPTMALHKFIGSLRLSLVASCTHTEGSRGWGRGQSSHPTRNGTTLPTNNTWLSHWQVPNLPQLPRARFPCSSPSFTAPCRGKELTTRSHYRTSSTDTEVLHREPGL